MKNKRFMTILAGCGLLVVFAAGAMAADDSGKNPAVDLAQLQALQMRMLGNPEIMTNILSLQNDPEMQALLADPAVVAAIQAGQYDSLVKDPRFVKLLRKPQVKGVEQQLRQE